MDTQRSYGKSSEQRNAAIGDAVKSVMAFVVKTQKPLVMEKLDFQKKKSALEEEFPPVSENALIACVHSGPDVSQGESF
jgi:hypothetical protein